MKRLFAVLIIILLASQLQAQYKPVIFGLRVGPNLGWMKSNVEEYDSYGVNMGFTWGFISEFYMMENYAISTGFNMNFIGGKMEYPYQMDIAGALQAGTLHREYNLKYIQVPLCLKMKSGLNEKLTMFAKIGLGTAFRIGAMANDDFNYESGTESDSKKDISDDIALMRESLIVGGGIELKIKESTAIIIELSYDNCFNNILTGQNPRPDVDDPKAVLNFVELGAGIVF